MVDDSSLVIEAREGSRDAVGQLFDRHWPGVWRSAFMVTGRRDLADDIAQDAFVRAIRALPSFDEDRHLGPWLTRIAVNRAIDVLRRERRAVIVLRYWLGYQLSDIGEILEIPVGTVSSRLSRALAELREYLEATMDDELEGRLHAARERIPGPSAEAMQRAREAVLPGQAPNRNRMSLKGGGRLPAILAMGAVMALGAGFFAGFAVANVRDLPMGPMEKGRLRAPASYPHLDGTCTRRGRPSLRRRRRPRRRTSRSILRTRWAACLIPPSRAWGPEGIVIFATFHPAGESEEVDRRFPERSLPLRLADAEPGGIEGQPDNVTASRLLGRVGTYNIDVIAFFGSIPSADSLDLADEELGRLVVPE
jgi:RNA polymerase sigma-70 factor (ECF subfamily)